MKLAIAALLLIAGMNTLARAQTEAPNTTGAQTDAQSADAPGDDATPDAASTTEPSTQPAVVNAQIPVRPARPLSRSSRNRNRRGQSAMSSPLVDPTPKPGQISGAFEIVMNRSIFKKGSQSTTDGGGIARSVNMPTVSERTLVFNGVTKGDNAIAMVENTDTHEVLKLRVGDEIARGKVVAISLDSLDYEVGGNVTHVAFGQTLSGGTFSGSSAAGTTQPSAGSAARQLGESIEAYLRRRRAMGL
jgi:hypothetical protein